MRMKIGARLTITFGIETMQGISASSAKVGEIISVIEGIAFQTNILALSRSSA